MKQLRQELSLSRRDLLRWSAMSAAGLAFGPKLGAWGEAPVPRAKSVIQIWMWGGPSHLDTFDPKPDAGYDYCGPLKSPIATNVDGIQICELLPNLAKQADKYAIIRSMTHGVNAHETASYEVQTGRQPGRLVYPSLGAVVAQSLGKKYTGPTPPYIVMTSAQGRFSEAGFLGQKYKPFVTGGDPNKEPFVVEGVVAEGIDDARQNARRSLMKQLDSLGTEMPDNPLFQQFDKSDGEAWDMMFGELRDLFDLNKESAEMRDAYGRNTFGQCCLMARRLVEKGTPYITINYKGWDTHKNHFQLMNKQLPEMDQAVAMLLTDLEAHGLLDSTIVWWSGEFGRTPKVQWEAPWNGGRGHFGDCFCAMLAGGGFKGGTVVGKSNATGESVEERPVYPWDLLASICTQLGIAPDAPLENPLGMDLQIMPVPEGAPSGGILKEIMT